MGPGAKAGTTKKRSPGRKLKHAKALEIQVQQRHRNSALAIFLPRVSELLSLSDQRLVQANCPK